MDRSEQITRRERDRIAARLRERYMQGATIRELMAQTGRSYGWVRTTLLEAGVVLRRRGGDHTTTPARRAAARRALTGAATTQRT
ncbi:MAG: helix-turn-helix domain-containing protein [Pseudonocardiaceae bacterium]